MVIYLYGLSTVPLPLPLATDETHLTEAAGSFTTELTSGQEPEHLSERQWLAGLAV